MSQETVGIQRSGWVQRLAWAPIPILIAGIIWCWAPWAPGVRAAYELTTLRLVLSFIFYTLVSLGALFIIGRSFLASGRPGLLLLECGLVLWSLAGTVGDLVGGPGVPGGQNINVTIYNTVILLAALCVLASAVYSLRSQKALEARAAWLGAGWAVSLGALALVTWSALEGWLPVFFVPGSGGTMVRYAVLIAAMVMFVLSAGLMLAGQRTTRSPFAYWYSLALLLLATGLFGIMVQTEIGTAVNWLGRTGQWLGGFYLLVAAIAAMHEWRLPVLPAQEKRLPGRYWFGMAIAIVLAAAALRLVFLPGLGMKAPFVTFFAAVILAALYGGWRAGMLATVLSALIVDYFWIAPAYNFGIHDPADWLSMGVFLASGAVISWGAEVMLRARARAFKAEAHAAVAEERATAAEALQLAYKRLQTFFDERIGGIGIAIGNAQGDILQANDYYLDMLGVTREEMKTGRARWREMTPAEWTATDEKCLAELKMRGACAPYEKEYEKRDGTRVPVYMTLVNMPGKGDEILAIVVNMTERKKSEEALRKSEERFKAIASHTPDHLVVQDSELRYEMVVNPQLGLTEEQMVGKTDFDLTTREDAEDLTRVKRKVLSSGQPVKLELPLATLSGEIQYFNGTYVPRLNAEGNVNGIIGYFRNVTERRRMEDDLRQSEQRYRALFNGMTEGFAIHEMLFDEKGKPNDYRFLDINPAFEILTGLKREEVMGRRVKEVLPGEDPKWVEMYGGVAMTGEPVHFENYSPVLKKHYEVFAYRPAEGQFAVVFMDITERKQAQAALQKAHDELEQRVSDRTAELTTMVEALRDEVGRRMKVEADLRERGEQLRMLAQELTLAEQQERRRLAAVLHDHLQQMLVAAKFRLAAMQHDGTSEVRQAAMEVDDLIDQSIETSGSSHRGIEPADIARGGTYTGAGMAGKMDAREARTAGGVEAGREGVAEDGGGDGADVPGGAGTAVQRGEAREGEGGEGGGGTPGRNGAGDGGGRRGGIRPGEDEAGDQNGRRDGTVQREGTTGIYGRGNDDRELAGEGKPIGVDGADEGSGGGFGRGEVAGDAVDEEGVGENGGEETKGKKKIRVMLADDHMVLRQGLARLIKEEKDMEVVAEAWDGETAVRLAREVRPDVVLMDVNMPTMNGVEATRAIRAELLEVQVIGLSMFEEEEKAAELREAGACMYMSKSGDTGALIAAIRKCGISREKDAH